MPIVNAKLFDFYKFSVAPNRYSQILIPPLPFLATNREAFVYMEAECPKVDKQYLCVDDTINRVKNHNDCARELVINHALGETCNLTTVTMKNEAMEQLDAGNYVLTFPQITKVHLHCGREEYKPLQGSYLITIPLNCSMMTSDFTISNENNQVSGQPLIISDVTYNFKEEPTPQRKFSLQSIDLKKLHDAYNHAMMEPNIERDPLSEKTLYHTTIPLYIIIIGTGTTFAIVLICRRYNLWRCSTQREPACNQSSSKPEQEDPEDPTAFPATFSIKVGK